MDRKKIRKTFSRLAAWWGLNISSLIVSLLPERCIYSFAEGLAGLAYCCAVKQRKIALNSLSIAFGKDKSPEEIRRIARDCFMTMAKSGVELMFLLNKPQLLRKYAFFGG
ncbi:MAG: hypothetical protein WC469_03945 [Candidatus Omnitrophota bacterium]